MSGGSGGAIIITAAATTTAGWSGSRGTVTTGTITIITGTITVGIVTSPESCCVPDSGATAVLRRVFLGREARRFMLMNAR
jgi:hypothetical protein